MLMKSLLGKPVAYSYGLLSVHYGLLGGMVACYFVLLGFRLGPVTSLG